MLMKSMLMRVHACGNGNQLQQTTLCLCEAPALLSTDPSVGKPLRVQTCSSVAQHRVAVLVCRYQMGRHTCCCGPKLYSEAICPVCRTPALLSTSIMVPRQPYLQLRASI